MNHNPTLLIVDDDPDDVELFMEAVSVVAPSVKCISMQDGKEALEFLIKATSLPNLIFLDLNMPRLNGFQCLKEIKRISRLSIIPVVIYSTSKQEEDETESRKLGAVEFITKPTHFEDICKAIKKTLRSNKPF